jgi:hypothetical protein
MIKKAKNKKNSKKQQRNVDFLNKSMKKSIKKH